MIPIAMTNLDAVANHQLQEQLEQLINAMARREWERMRLLLTAHPNLVHAWDEKERDFPLILATLWEERAAVRILLDSGADINVKGEAGKTPLHRASQSHLVEMMALLLERRADVEARDHRGRTPLELANSVHSGSREAIQCTRMLLQHGADANITDGDGKRPLHLVQKGVRSAIVLLAFGADPNGRDHSGRTPLHEAAQWSAMLVSLLIKHGADVHARDADGQTPLFNAVWHWASSGEEVRRLLAAGADPRVRDYYQQTPLHSAAARHCVEGARELITAGADINARDIDGKTPLYRARRGPFIVDDPDYRPGTRGFRLGRSEIVTFLKGLGGQG